MEVTEKGTVYMDDDTLVDFGLEPGQRVLFVHAHPDDESVGSGQALHLLGQLGIEVHVLLATDGTESTLGDPQFVKQGKRRQEAEDALDVFNVRKSRRHYPGFMDGQLSSSIKPLADKIGQLATKINAAAIFTPGADGFDGHQDHIAAHQAAIGAAKQMPVPPKVWALSREGGQVGLLVDSEQKLLAISKHHSQFPGAADQNLPDDTALYLSHYKDLIYGTEWYSPVPIQTAGTLYYS